MKFDVPAATINQLVYQHLREQNLHETADKLRQESNLQTNIVPRGTLAVLILNVKTRRWDQVFKTLKRITLAEDITKSLQHYLASDLVKQGEIELVQQLGLSALKNPLSIENLCKRLEEDLIEVPNQRLPALLQHSFQWLMYQGLFSGNYDFLTGETKKVDNTPDEEKLFKSVKQLGKIKFGGSQTHVECAKFSPNGMYLAVGTVDGFVEFYDYRTCKHAADLDYQNEDNLLMHESSVLCLDFSRDSELLVTGSSAGEIVVWRVSTGKRLRRIVTPGNAGVTSLCFAPNGLSLFASSENVARHYGLKSGGNMLKEFRGHSSFVNCLVTFGDNKLCTGSADGTIRFWSDPPKVVETPGLSNVLQLYNVLHKKHIYACTAKGVFVYTRRGDLVSSYDFRHNHSIISTVVSRSAKFIHAVLENPSQLVYIDTTASEEVNEEDHLKWKLVPSKKMNSHPVLGIALHPHKNVLVSYDGVGVLRVWGPKEKV